VLFAPFLDAKATQQSPAFDFEVDFRVNKSQEQGGHRIIDWHLTIGEREFRHLDTERRGRWYHGDPIRFSLRWAKDAYRLPIEQQNQAAVEVQDATVTYTYTNSWSLISFLRRHAGSPGDYAYFFDPRPHTLIFRVATKPVGQEDDSLPTEAHTTKVFVRLRILSSDHQEEMIVPDFPVSAPPLQQDPSQVLSSALDP
jgi:type VI secretion system protein ImpL